MSAVQLATFPACRSADQPAAVSRLLASWLRVLIQQQAGQPTDRPEKWPAEQLTPVDVLHRPASQPAGQLAGHPAGQPAEWPAGWPAGQPAGRSVTSLAGQLASQPACRLAGQLTGCTAWPASRLARWPAGRLSGQPAGQLAGGWLASRLVGRPAAGGFLGCPPDSCSHHCAC